MNSTRPYLVRAIHSWAMDNNMTPQILVCDDVDGVKVPSKYVKDGHIVFNVHDAAIRDLHLGNDLIAFTARFSGRSINIEVPLDAVLAIYARENGQGIFFQEQEHTPPPGSIPPTDGAKNNEMDETKNKAKDTRKTKLKLVR